MEERPERDERIRDEEIEAVVAWVTRVLAESPPSAREEVSSRLAEELSSRNVGRVWRIICWICALRPVSGGGD